MLLGPDVTKVFKNVMEPLLLGTSTVNSVCGSMSKCDLSISGCVLPFG